MGNGVSVYEQHIIFVVNHEIWKKRVNVCTFWEAHKNFSYLKHALYIYLVKDSYRYWRNTPTLIFEIWNQ
jgi:hypothetical protein